MYLGTSFIFVLLWNILIRYISSLLIITRLTCTVDNLFCSVIMWNITFTELLNSAYHHSYAVVNVHFFFHFLSLKFFFIAEQHYDDLRYYCPKNCGRSYVAVSSLTRHLEYECGGVRQFGCPFCSKMFKQKVHKRRHIATVHKCILK